MKSVFVCIYVCRRINGIIRARSALIFFLIDIARSISVAIAFHGGKSGNCDFDKRLTEGFEDLNTGKL